MRLELTDEQRKLEYCHRAAMRWADRAAGGSGHRARRHNEIAARLEQMVALAIQTDMEPSRSILLCSAGTLFLRADRPRLALRSIRLANAGFPPHFIREDLGALAVSAHIHWAHDPPTPGDEAL